MQLFCRLFKFTLSSAKSGLHKAFQRFRPRKIHVRNPHFCEAFCEDAARYKITSQSPTEEFNYTSRPPLSSNPPYATFLFHSAAQATGKACNANTVHWTQDTWCIPHSTATAVVKSGGDSWFFITAESTIARRPALPPAVGSISEPIAIVDFVQFPHKRRELDFALSGGLHALVAVEVSRRPIGDLR